MYICNRFQEMSENTQIEEPTLKNAIDPKGWVNLYSDYLYNYAVFRVNNMEQARDLVQETFLSALKAIDGFRGDSNEKTWLVTILKRKIIDYYKKKSTQSIQDSIEISQATISTDDYFEKDGDNEGSWSKEYRPIDWPKELCIKMETKEFYQMLTKCLSFLPAKWASLFNMKNIEEIETTEICKELQITSSNYWVLMHRTKIELRKCVEKNWFGINK